ncbi:MAG: hypothetical protein QXE68_02220 [Sulfolobales archaeon]
MFLIILGIVAVGFLLSTCSPFAGSSEATLTGHKLNLQSLPNDLGLRSPPPLL